MQYTSFGSDATSPYAYSWTNVSAGKYIITAVATDNSGNKTTSATDTIIVTVPQGPYNGKIHSIPGIFISQISLNSKPHGRYPKINIFKVMN